MEFVEMPDGLESDFLLDLLYKFANLCSGASVDGGCWNSTFAWDVC